uniref:Uncharacterized protein n=1 Tax=Glossina palpalis gambiensis TaxID=67801 RepID=A0A1B0BCD1_9MUSC
MQTPTTTMSLRTVHMSVRSPLPYRLLLFNNLCFNFIFRMAMTGDKEHLVSPNWCYSVKAASGVKVATSKPARESNNLNRIAALKQNNKRIV